MKRARCFEGKISGTALAFLASVVLAAALAALLARKPGGSGPGKEPILLYCAAGLRGPVEAIAREYEAAHGVPVHLQYGGSQTLLATFQVSPKGDLYLPADETYLSLAREKGLVEETIPVAQMTAVLAFRKGRFKLPGSLKEFLGSGASLALANPDAAAVGKVARAALEKAGLWDEVSRKVRVMKPTVTDVASDIKLGSVDAGFIWDALSSQYPELELVRLPELEGATAHIAVGVLSSARRPRDALHFARYLTARDRGLVKFKEMGYGTVDGDAWADRPRLRLLGGAMLRVAIEETIKRFEEREGAEVTRVYNGCGVLVAQMKAGDRPDAYFSCDVSFMEKVHDIFVDEESISENRLAILVPKGNPRGIKGPKDLGAPGLRLGVGQAKQSTLGALTKNLLASLGLEEEVAKNVAVESPTGDFLVNQLRAGALDAAVAYESNAGASRGEIEVIPIEGPSALAVQPVAVGRESEHKELARRLVSAIKSRASRDRFERSGFQWHKRQD